MVAAEPLSFEWDAFGGQYCPINTAGGIMFAAACDQPQCCNGSIRRVVGRIVGLAICFILLCSFTKNTLIGVLLASFYSRMGGNEQDIFK